jgi:hypothetical protein
MRGQDNWVAIVFEMPSAESLDSGKELSLGVYPTWEEASAAALEKCESIGGLGYAICREERPRLAAQG